MKFEGKLGGLSFYRFNGGYFVRMPGGLTKEMVRDRASCLRVRENNWEFSGAAKVGKVFRVAFGSFTHQMRDRFLTPRLTQVFRKICDLGAGGRGSRSITISSFGHLLKGQRFHAERSFASVFTLPLAVSHDADRTIIRAHVPHVLPQEIIRSPKGATHVQLWLAAISMSDFVADAGAGYVPLVRDLNGLHCVSGSGLLALDGGGWQPNTLEAVFANVSSFPAEVSVIVAMGVAFYQRVDGVDYPLGEGKCMDVVEVF